MSVPHDRALPTLGALLDPEAMAPLLERSLGRPACVELVRIARVSYKPQERASIHYEVRVDGRDEDVVARAVAGRDLASRARDDGLRELARRVDGRSPAASPVFYDPAVNALLTWLPLDPRLPALAERPSELARRLRNAGARPGPWPAEPRRLSYKPRRRVALHFGGLVLKVYASSRQYDSAARALRSGSPFGGIATPACAALLAPLLLTAQVALDGVAVSSPTAAAEAGGLLRGLQTSDLSWLRPMHGSQLEVAARKAELIAVVVPSLADRVSSLVRRLGESEPPTTRLVPAHGDFHAGQLLRVGRDLCVLDLDAACLAAPALDPAEFAAAAVADSGIESGLAALDAFVDGYGERPPELEWHFATALLIRASHPFHRQLPAWPRRTEALVEATEAILGRSRTR